MKKKSIVVRGDSQAEALALVLRSLPAVGGEYDVSYVSEGAAQSEADEAALQNCAIVCEQQQDKVRPSSSAKDPKKQRRIRFPSLQFNLLWPLTCVNAFNRAEPPDYPFGRFPYGDSFILSCVRRKLPIEQIMAHYSAQVWPATWPNLDKLFQAESARLSAQDAHNDIKIGAFILKYFRKKRLFWAPKNPSNVLFAEMVFRLLHAAFGPEQPTDRSDLEAVLFPMGPRDLLASMSVPVHPLVARHFKLEWYNSDARYTYFDHEYTHDEYFSEMIEHALAFDT